ncbi:hypothetical protein B0H13DRAFT_1902769 [Mycena leptocephala]|nr:hypothetical protein B0H13DRAFT_1902769 [Mycena leptocephala]
MGERECPCSIYEIHNFPSFVWDLKQFPDVRNHTGSPSDNLVPELHPNPTFPYNILQGGLVSPGGTSGGTVWLRRGLTKHEEKVYNQAAIVLTKDAQFRAEEFWRTEMLIAEEELGHTHFHVWSRKILDSLPPFLRLAFPATLSRKAGLSRNVLSILRV